MSSAAVVIGAFRVKTDFVILHLTIKWSFQFQTICVYLYHPKLVKADLLVFCINAGTKAIDCLNCKRANPDDAAKIHNVKKNAYLMQLFFLFGRKA